MSQDDLLTFREWFRSSLSGREIFVNVPVWFADDDFNLYDIHNMPHFNESLELILEDEEPSPMLLGDIEQLQDLVRVYEALHQRYILTKHGLNEMVKELFYDTKY